MLAITLLAAFAGGCHAAPSSHATEWHETFYESAPTPGTPDPERVALATKVSNALLTSGYLQVNARILHQGKELLVRSDMTPDKLRVEAFRDNTLIAAFAINGDRVQEYRPLLVPTEDGFEYRNVVVEFDTLDVVEGAVSVGSTMLLDPDTACEFGTLMTSWLDPQIDFVSKLHNRVLHGAQLESQTIGDVRCDVFHESVTVPMDDTGRELTVKNTIYIDPQTALPVRWDTSQSTSEYSIERERYYEFVRAAKAPDFIAWTLDHVQIRSATPPALSPAVSLGTTP